MNQDVLRCADRDVLVSHGHGGTEPVTGSAVDVVTALTVALELKA